MLACLSNSALSNTFSQVPVLVHVTICPKKSGYSKAIGNLPKIQRAKFLASDGLFCLWAYASLARTHLQQLVASLNFTLDSEDLFCWYKPKNWFLWTMAAAQATKNHSDVWGLITWHWQWGIDTSVPNWIYIHYKVEAAEAMSLNTSSRGTPLKWSERQSHSVWEWE